MVAKGFTCAAPVAGGPDGNKFEEAVVAKGFTCAAPVAGGPDGNKFEDAVVAKGFTCAAPVAGGVEGCVVSLVSSLSPTPSPSDLVSCLLSLGW